MQLRFLLLGVIFSSACAAVSPREPTFLPLPYLMCEMLSRLPAAADDVAASASFHQAMHDDQAGRHDAAAVGFLRTATLQHDFLYNRRVAYANAVNTLLSAQRVDQARAALLTSAPTDPELAAELTAWAAALPHAAACVLK